MQCLHCKSDNREEAQFCKSCGKSVVVKLLCPFCMEEIKVGAVRCKHCQASLIDYNCRNAYNNRGVSYGAQGKYAESIVDFTKAIEIDPKYVYGYDNRGSSYRVQGKYAEAIVDYTKAIEIDPKCVYAYNNRGISYEDQGKYAEAIVDYTKAIEIDPKYVYAYNNRGESYFKQSLFDNALEDCARVLELDGNNGYVHTTKAKIFSEISDNSNLEKTIAQAERTFQLATDSKTKTEKACYLAEIYCIVNKDIPKALELALEAVKILPNYDNYYILGFCYFRNGDIQQAIQTLGLSRKLNPYYTELLMLLGRCYKSAGDTAKARQIWEEGLKVNPNDRFIKAELEK